jgi:hypothetical protein
MRVMGHRHIALLLVVLLLLCQVVPVCITKHVYFDEPQKAESFFLLPVSLSNPVAALTKDSSGTDFRALAARKFENRICQINIYRLCDRVALAILPVSDVRRSICEVMSQYFNGSKYKLIRPSI